MDEMKKETEPVKTEQPVETLPEETALETQETVSDKKQANTEKLLVLIALIVLASAVIVGAIVAISQWNDTTPAKITASDAGGTSDSASDVQQAGHNESAQVISGEDATEKAEVKNADAIELIRNFSDEQLGVKKEDYTFMISQQAYVIEGKEYVQVIAAEKKENEDGTFSITPYGKYYISFNGKTVLKENMEQPGVYEKLK